MGNLGRLAVRKILQAVNPFQNYEKVTIFRHNEPWIHLFIRLNLKIIIFTTLLLIQNHLKNSSVAKTAIAD